MQKRYTGSCHCGAVRFECSIDLAEGTSKCNCSVCTKARFWKAIVRADAFQLVEGRDDLHEYQFGGHSIQHFFCRHCGIKTFGRGHLEALGGEFYAVSVVCLDNVPVEELSRAPVRFEDGRQDNWANVPAETRSL